MMIQAFDGTENKHDVYRDGDCMKKFSESFIEHAMETINFKKKKVVPLKNKDYKSYLNQKYGLI